MPATISIAFLLGLASTLHCWGMCGGILGAFTLGIPEWHDGQQPRRRTLIASFNIGRVATYSLAGALAGAAGAALLALPWRAPLFIALQVTAGMILVLAGLRLGGWLHRDSRLEAAGARAWSYVQPLCRHLLPVDRLSRALGLGMLWGWMPCGLVYSALAWSAASADAGAGALTMLAFGAGTLPGMIGAGLAAAGLGARFTAGALRRVLAALLVVLGMAGPMASWYFASPGATHGDHGGHHGHHGVP